MYECAFVEVLVAKIVKYTATQAKQSRISEGSTNLGVCLTSDRSH